MDQTQANPESNLSSPDAELAAAILDYLNRRPLAMDTAEGIAEWWLMQQQIHIGFHAVLRAIQDLTAQGLLEEIGSGGKLYYRLKADEAK